MKDRKPGRAIVSGVIESGATKQLSGSVHIKTISTLQFKCTVALCLKKNTHALIKKHFLELPWWPSGETPELPIQGSWVFDPWFGN